MKNLHRSQADRKLAGVCGGIAERLEIDATFVRLFTAAAAVFSFGTVLVFYLAAWLLLPFRQAESRLAASPAGYEADSPLMSHSEELAMRCQIETLRARMASCEPDEREMQNIR